MSYWEDDRGQRFGDYGYGYGYGYGSRSLHNLSGFRNFSTGGIYGGDGGGYGRRWGYYDGRYLDRDLGRRGYFVGDFQGGTYGGGSSRGTLSGGLREQGTGQGLGHTAAGGGIEEVHVNTNLLRPTQVQVDPEFQKMRSDEKEQIKTLNNKFASFIDKVSPCSFSAYHGVGNASGASYVQPMHLVLLCISSSAPKSLRWLDSLLPSWLATNAVV